MQTIERPIETPGPPRRGPGPGAVLIAALLALPVLVLLVMSKWGVLIAVSLSAVFGLGLWVWRRGFAFIEMVAFSIHFDGVGFGEIRLGRAVALTAALVLIYKLVVERWRPPAIPVRHWMPVMALLIVGVLSGAWSASLGAYFGVMGLLGLAVAYFCVSGLMVDSHAKIDKYLRAYWVGGLWGSGPGILALFLGTRSVGFGADPNFFGLLQASLIPLTVYYRRQARTPSAKWWYSFALLYILVGAAGAGSRSGLIGAAVAIVGTMVTRPGLTPGRRVRVAFGAVVLATVAFLVGFVANPNNLQRGFADRGAGRLDIWTISFDMVGQKPIQGWGLGQLALEIPKRMPVTPGVQSLTESREIVSAHNTWLEIIGDLGLLGMVPWVAVFIVTIVGFMRPRWKPMKELSTTMLVMMLPVLSSSQFLPLRNNKLAWSLIGLSAALQVPSWGTRWRGFLAASDTPALPPAGHREPSGGSGGTATLVRPDEVAGPGGAVLPSPDQDWESPALARWDLRISRRFRMVVVAGAVLGALVFNVFMSQVPVRYSANADLIVPWLEAPPGTEGVGMDRSRVQSLHTLVDSDAYAAQLKELSGLPLSIRDIRNRMSVARVNFGMYMTITYTDTSEANARRAGPHLVTALDNVLASTRDFALDQVKNERRPIFPGEQRFYSGPLYFRAGDSSLGAQVPRSMWATLVGGTTGALVALCFVLLQQRRPRINNDDDFPAAVGMSVWAHVGRAGRRYAATPDQYAQVTAMAADMVSGGEYRHFVVATPRPDRAARSLATGVAAALAAAGRRVVLVDAQVDRPLLSRRLAGPLQPGLIEVAEGQVPLSDVVCPVSRWRLPSSVRRMTRRRGDLLRFVPAGRAWRRSDQPVTPQLVDHFDPDVTLVVLAPSLLGTVSAGSLLAWGDAVVLALVEGRTITFDAEDAAVQMRTFVGAPSGVVLLDV